jgi:hypothetical protein
MTDERKPEPKRPAPSCGSTSLDWSRLTQKEFEKKEREMREDIRNSGDFI